VAAFTSDNNNINVISLPRLSSQNMKDLKDHKYVVVENFLPELLQQELRLDVHNLRNLHKFRVARIGQDSTNARNEKIRVAETVFLGPSKLPDVPNAHRDTLYQILDGVRNDLARYMQTPLDDGLTELLYAHYPQGGFYRRHRDAIPGSASTLRKYSLLLYINDETWNCQVDGGALRMHFDSGGDELPKDEEPNYQDIHPTGGTLVLFQSDAIPHEVLDTQKERMAVIGWYNRPVTATDVVDLGDAATYPLRLAMLAVAAGLVTVGIMGIII
jgi:SM-20-related protein